MSTISNPYETTHSTWLDEFRKAYVDWVDLDLISALLESNGCSIRFLCETINDLTRWPSKINKTLNTVSYPKIRDAADFLGIPPWLLFNHEEKNSKIKELFQNNNSIHKPIQLPYFSEYNDHWEDFRSGLYTRVKTKDDYTVLLSKLDEILSCKNQNYVIAGNWKAVFGFINDIHRDFSGGAKFTYRGLERIISGHLRVNYTTNPREYKPQIKSGWLAIELEQSGKKPTTEFNNFLSTVISDMEWIFDQPPWQFTVETQNKQIRLLMWHTLRKNDQFYETVSALIHRKLPNANFTMNIDDQFNKSNSDSSVSKINIYEELIQILKEDVTNTSTRDQKKRRANTLNILIEKKLLHNGDHIIFIPQSQIQDWNDGDPRYNATIIQEDNKIRVKWHFDNEIHSISSITRLILDNLNGHPYLTRTHLNGNKYWRLTNADKSLYSMVADQTGHLNHQ